jgi:hypothetical protein
MRLIRPVFAASHGMAMSGWQKSTSRPLTARQRISPQERQMRPGRADLANALQADILRAKGVLRSGPGT